MHYQAVMAIDDNVYEGEDYLPIFYHDFIKDPLTRCYVLEIDNTVVGLYDLFLLLFSYTYTNIYTVENML